MARRRNSDRSLNLVCRAALGVVALGWLFGGLAGSLSAQPYDDAPRSLRVMTWNVEWMFDNDVSDNRSQLAREQSAPSLAYWEAKLSNVAAVLAQFKPTIVALQEIEGEQTLIDLVARLKVTHSISYRCAFIPGTDRITEQDVGMLVRDGLVNYRRYEQSWRMFHSEQFFNLSKHMAAEFRWGNVNSPLTVMTLHLRATAQAEEIRIKQARLARLWLNEQLKAGEDVILLGDLNTEYLAKRPEEPAPVGPEMETILGGDDGPGMVDLLSRLPNPSQSTHLILDKQFDRIIVSDSMMVDEEGEDWSFVGIEILSEAVVRGHRDKAEHWSKRLTMPIEELDVSDHLPVMATFERR